MYKHVKDMRQYGPRKVLLETIGRDGALKTVRRNLMPLSEASINKMLQHASEGGMIGISANRSAIRSTDPRLDLTDEFEADMRNRYGSVDMIDSDALMGEMDAWLRERNARRDRELKNDIKSAGYSYTPNFGGYHGNDQVVDSYEPSYVVYAHDRSGALVDFQELVEFGLEMCRKYDQESVLVKGPGDEPPRYLDAEGNEVDMSLQGGYTINRDDAEFYMTPSRKKGDTHKLTFTESSTRAVLPGPVQCRREFIFEDMFVQLRPADYNENMRRLKSGEYIL